MDSISTARDFFINQQGLSPDQADMIVSKGMEAYNQQTQPQPQQNMMQMASGGIARLGYGFGNLVKGSGVAEPVSGGDTSGGGFGGMGLMGKLIQQNPQMFRRVETARPNFIDVNQNGIDDRQEAAYGGRIGYQMGGSPMGVEAMPMDTGQSLQVPQQMPTNFSSAQSITMNPLLNYGQPELGQAGGTPLSMNRGGIARLGYESGGVTLPSQGSEMSQMQGMDQQQALQTIIQILIENGVPPEQAQQLALQIIQIFAQGGAPAVEAFADQLEQEEVQAMAQGGVAGYAYRQGYGFGGIGKIFSGAAKAVSGVVKGVAKAVKAVAKSPIGRAALTIGAATFLGPGAFGFSGLGLSGLQLGLATAAANAGLQKLGGGKFSLLEAGLSGLSAGLSNPTVPASNAANITTSGVDAANAYNAAGVGNTTIPADIGSYAGSVQNVYDPGIISSTALETYGPQGMPNVGPVTDAAKAYTDPTVIDKISQFGDTVKSGITNLYQDPLGTISRAAGSAFDYANDPKNLGTIATVGGLSGLALLGSQLGVPRNEGEDDESYAKRLQDTQGYITQYGRNLQIKNPYFYQKEGAVNPFAPTMAANGGIMGYRKGGSMVPPARQIEGGVIELDARKSGGYIPYGKKERVDDVPAMLAKDEFVFTSRAVKAAGGGSAKRGAEKMYALMKQLEAKGARA
jgi:hypothetical protein